MAIALRGTPQSANSATLQSIAVNVPTGVVNGDLLVAAIVGYGASPTAPATPTDPSGWTKIGVAGTTGSTTGDVNVGWYYRIASSEPASYTFSVTGGTAGIDTNISAYSGEDQVTPFNRTGVSNTGHSNTPTSADPGATTVDGCWHLLEYHTWDAVSSGYPPAGYTSDLQYDASTNEVAHKLISPAGATGAQSFTSVAATGGWVAWTAAIQVPQATVAQIAHGYGPN